MANARLHVVLYKPLIHWNTGAIGRTCLGFGAKLHLIKPLGLEPIQSNPNECTPNWPLFLLEGFELDDKKIRRAGLNYWQDVDSPFILSIYGNHQ